MIYVHINYLHVYYYTCNICIIMYVNAYMYTCVYTCCWESFKKTLIIMMFPVLWMRSLGKIMTSYPGHHMSLGSGFGKWNNGATPSDRQTRNLWETIVHSTHIPATYILMLKLQNPRLIELHILVYYNLLICNYVCRHTSSRTSRHTHTCMYMYMIDLWILPVWNVCLWV